MASRYGTQIVTYPNEFDVVTTRSFDAPAELVFLVLTSPTYIPRWYATGEDRMTTCESSFAVGGPYHYVFVTPDDVACSFRGEFLAIDPPHRVSCTWLFEGWPDAWAVETNEVTERSGVSTLTTTLSFRTAEGARRLRDAHRRAASSGETNGHAASLDAMESILTSLTASGTAT